MRSYRILRATLSSIIFQYLSTRNIRIRSDILKEVTKWGVTFYVRKLPFIAVFAVVFASATFALAQTVEQAQGSAGGGGENTSSAGYQAKAAAADPGVGTSQSSNYVYDHGTLWFEDVAAYVPPAPSPAPSGGGGTGTNSGSGWLSNLFGSDPQIGGISPEADVPFTDTPESASVVAEIPKAAFSAVKAADAPSAVLRMLENPRYEPQIVRLVDEKGVTRELNIVLFRRIVPWPLWIAFTVIALGIVVLVGFAVFRGAKDYLLWIGVPLVLVGIIGGVVTRYTYRSVPIDTKAITSIGVVPVSEADATVKKLMAEMPIGVHVVEATDSTGRKALTVKVFITSALPI